MVTEPHILKKHSTTLSVRMRLRQAYAKLTSSERKLACLLEHANPSVALGSIKVFAERARVSAPTVTRFVTKLGYKGFVEFQTQWLSDISEIMHSPLSHIDLTHANAPPSFASHLALSLTQAIEQMNDLDGTVELLSKEKNTLFFYGGRFSYVLANYAQAHVCQIRSNTFLLPQDYNKSHDALIDLKRHDVLWIFDYRRYQLETVQLAKIALERGANIVLFTDPWMSPIAHFAKQVIVSSVDVPSPFDTLVPAMAQVEFLCKELLKKAGDKAEKRMLRLEKSRPQLNSQ